MIIPFPMAKQLGMIHTVNQEKLVSYNTTTNTWMVTSLTGTVQNGPTVDLSGELTRQLHRMVRQGQYYKLVGMDIALAGPASEGFMLTGRLEYFAPTRGRCMAYRNAYRSVINLMKDQGINYRADDLYDFRVQWSGVLSGATDPQWYGIEDNIATVDATNPLCLVNGASTNDNIFKVHNSNVAPASPSQTDPLTFGAYGSTTNFRLNRAQPYTGNSESAH